MRNLAGRLDDELEPRGRAVNHRVRDGAIERHHRVVGHALQPAQRGRHGALRATVAGEAALTPRLLMRILDEFRSSYVLRYTPRGVDRPGWHEIDVRIVRPGSFTVRARKGYERVR